MPDQDIRRSILFLCFMMVFAAGAWGDEPSAEKPPAYLNTSLTFEQRADDLVARMPLEEKISQMMYDAPAIEHLGMAAYQWGSDDLSRITEPAETNAFPVPLALAATFDSDLVRRVGQVVSNSVRARHHRDADSSLTAWGPSINILRDPRWGHGQETYGEDPFLTGRLATAYIKGLQGEHENYLKTAALIGHFAVYSGPESERHRLDAIVSERDLWETYLPAFETVVRQAHGVGIIAARNRVNGVPACGHDVLLQKVLREKWGFAGVVACPCGALADIHQLHQFAPSPGDAAVLALRNGCDLFCRQDYAHLLEAAQQGLISAAEVDTAVKRVMLIRFRLGSFDPPEQTPWAKIGAQLVDDAARDQLALEAARASIVLLKNENSVLPLSADIKTLAVVGPCADLPEVLVAHTQDKATSPMTPLRGLREKVGDRIEVLYAKGSQIVAGYMDQEQYPVVPTTALNCGSEQQKPGLQGEYFSNGELLGEPILVRVDGQVDLDCRDLQAGQADTNACSARWTGQLMPPISGDYEFALTGRGGGRLYVGGRLLIDGLKADKVNDRATVTLEANQSYDIRVELLNGTRASTIRLRWRRPDMAALLDAAVDIAQKADAVVMFGGLPAALLGKDMSKNYPGFSKGDRTNLQLPQTQQDLLMALQQTGKPIVLVLLSGGPLAVCWADEHIPAIVQAWYPGAQAGMALADVLCGDVNPSGRLPVTCYRSVEQLGDFADYGMQGRTYRYFRGRALYPFGHGLSYTNVEYADLYVSPNPAAAHAELAVSFSLHNRGSRAGTEVAQLYVTALSGGPNQPIKQLCGWARISLEPGASQTVALTLPVARAMACFDVEKQAYQVKPGRYEIQVGSSAQDIRLAAVVEITSD